MYRVKLQDSRRHDQLPHSQIMFLIQNGIMDLDDSIAPAGSEQWIDAWDFEGAFEASVSSAYRKHAKAIHRMRRSIASGWLTVVEFRDQRDGLLLGEPGVKESMWASRPRPDLATHAAGHELFAAAAEGAALQAAAANRTERRVPPRRGVQARRGGGQVFRGNVAKILQGDWPPWADPKALLATAKANAFKIFFIACLLALFTDPLRPWIHLQWFVVGSGIYAIYAALRQLGSAGKGRFWADRFVSFVLFTLFFTVLLVVTAKTEPRDRAGVLSRFPQVARLQEKIQKWQEQPLN